MIANITGTIININSRSLIVDVNGVGYEVNTTESLSDKVKQGSVISLFTHLHVREDIMELYGFLLPLELDFFKKLISVSGVGPKSALTIMSLASVTELCRAIVQEDDSLLTKVSGIGEKTAKRLIIELKNKLDVKDFGELPSGANPEGDGQVIDGLVGLGYSAKEARDTLKMINSDIEGVKDRLKAALKLLGKND